MTNSEVENIEVGDYICRVTDVYKGVPIEDSIVEKPKKVTRVAYKGTCEGKGDYFGKQFVVFHHESYLIDSANESASCYAGDEYYIVPTESQRKNWSKGIKYTEFIKMC